MNQRIAIQGIAALGGFGGTVDDLRSAISHGSPPDAPILRADTSPLTDFISSRKLRRIDHFSRMALLGAHRVRQDAQALELDPKRTAVVVASGYGPTATTFAFLDTVIDEGCSMASPTLFASSVHNTAAAYISMFLEIEGPSLSVTQFEMSVPSALMTACLWLTQGRVDAVILGGIDEYCPCLGYCLDHMFPAPEAPCEPLDFDRHTAVPGEGAGFLLLTRPSDAGEPYGYIDKTELGILQPGTILGVENQLTLLGADGHPCSGQHYATCLHPGARLESWTQIYGSFPAAYILDLIVAVIKLKDEERICCLKLSVDGEYAATTLSA